MDTTALVLEITSGLLFAATGMAALLVGTALVLGHAISMNAEQREAPIATREPPRLPARYATRARRQDPPQPVTPSATHTCTVPTPSTMMSAVSSRIPGMEASVDMTKKTASSTTPPK